MPAIVAVIVERFVLRDAVIASVRDFVTTAIVVTGAMAVISIAVTAVIVGIAVKKCHIHTTIDLTER